MDLFNGRHEGPVRSSARIKFYVKNDRTLPWAGIWTMAKEKLSLTDNSKFRP